jgi:hypothetical protein
MSRTLIGAVGASHINYPPDKFVARTIDEWKEKNIPSIGIAKAWADIREMATQGHPLAVILVRIDAAMSAKKIATAEVTCSPMCPRL